jgi:hypothetical protein
LAWGTAPFVPDGHGLTGETVRVQGFGCSGAGHPALTITDDRKEW